MSPEDPRHGTPRGYFAHRKDGEEACEACRRAHAGRRQWYLSLKARGEVLMVDATGTRRRIQALCRAGWSVMEQARQLGVTEMAVRNLLTQTTVQVSTAARHMALYERLCEVTPPPGRSATRARSHAVKRGWHPPSAWFDIDDPNEQPDFGGDKRMSPAEKLAEFEWLTSLGVSDDEALRQVGWTHEAMEKHLERTKKEAA